MVQPSLQLQSAGLRPAATDDARMTPTADDNQNGEARWSARYSVLTPLIPPEAGVAGSNPAKGALPQHAKTAADQRPFHVYSVVPGADRRSTGIYGPCTDAMTAIRWPDRGH